MQNEEIKSQYIEYIENQLKMAFSLSAWHEHTTGTILDLESHDEITAEVVIDIGEALPKVIGGTY